MQPTLCCQLAINVNHSLEAPPKPISIHPIPHGNKTSQQFVFTCEPLRGPHVLFSEVDRLGSGGRSEHRKVGFKRRVAVRWKTNTGAMLRSQSRKKKFFSFQPGQRVGAVLSVALTSRIERHYVQSGAAFLSFPELRWNVASWAGGGINCKNVST